MLDKEKIGQIVKAYTSTKMTIPKIAEKFNVTPQRVFLIIKDLRARGIPIPRRRPPKCNPSAVHDYVESYKKRH